MVNWQVFSEEGEMREKKSEEKMEGSYEMRYS